MTSSTGRELPSVNRAPVDWHQKPELSPSSESFSDQSELICNLCFDEITDQQPRYVPSCGHALHLREAVELVVTSNALNKDQPAACPSCRVELDLVVPQVHQKHIARSGKAVTLMRNFSNLLNEFSHEVSEHFSEGYDRHIRLGEVTVQNDKNRVYHLRDYPDTAKKILDGMFGHYDEELVNFSADKNLKIDQVRSSLESIISTVDETIQPDPTTIKALVQQTEDFISETDALRGSYIDQYLAQGQEFNHS